MLSVFQFLAQVAIIAAQVPSEWTYIVNEFFDDSLESMKNGLRDQGGFVALESVVVGGYTLEGAQIGDLSILRRHGNVSISSQGEIITLTGNIELPNMVVKGGNITSLDKTIINPVIRFNG